MSVQGGGIFEACPGGGGQRWILTDGWEGGAFYVNLIVSKGKNTTDYRVQGDTFIPIRGFPIYKVYCHLMSRGNKFLFY